MASELDPFENLWEGFELLTTLSSLKKRENYTHIRFVMLSAGMCYISMSLILYCHSQRMDVDTPLNNLLHINTSALLTQEHKVRAAICKHDRFRMHSSGLFPFTALVSLSPILTCK